MCRSGGKERYNEVAFDSVCLKDYLKIPLINRQMIQISVLRINIMGYGL